VHTKGVLKRRFTEPDGCRITPDHLMLIAKDGN